MSRRLAIIGGGGHARVVIAAAQASGWNVVGIYDDAEDLKGGFVLGVPVLGKVEAARHSDTPLIVGIGYNPTRRMIVEQLSEDVAWATVIHPFSWIHESVQLGEGVVVFAGAVLQPSARIGSHGIINTGASVDHDCDLGSYVHIAPGTRLAGNVRLDEGVFCGIGSSVIPGIHIGGWSTIGAGAAVVRDIPDHVIAVGMPASVIKSKE